MLIRQPESERDQILSRATAPRHSASAVPWRNWTSHMQATGEAAGDKGTPGPCRAQPYWSPAVAWDGQLLVRMHASPLIGRPAEGGQTA